MSKKGTYVGVRVSEKSRSQLIDLAKKYHVPNIIRPKRLHSTIVYSFKHLPDFVKESEVYHEAIVKDFVLFDNPDGSKVLALELESNSLNERNRVLMEEYGDVTDYPQYRLHITLSYEIGDFKLPSLEEKISITFDEEYTFELNFDK